MQAQLIPNEQLNLCKFTSSDVLHGDWEKVYRNYSLQRAVMLGKRNAARVRISFRTMSNEVRMVKSVVSSLSDQFVFLNGGYTIPVAAILMVEF